jgi:hypothetical protein
MNKLGFINYSTGWEKGKMFYTFWYAKEKPIDNVKQNVSNDHTVEVLYELFPNGA